MGEPYEVRLERRNKHVKEVMDAVCNRYNFNHAYYSDKEIEEHKVFEALYLICWYGIENGVDLEGQFQGALNDARNDYPSNPGW